MALYKHGATRSSKRAECALVRAMNKADDERITELQISNNDPVMWRCPKCKTRVHMSVNRFLELKRDHECPACGRSIGRK